MRKALAALVLKLFRICWMAGRIMYVCLMILLFMPPILLEVIEHMGDKGFRSRTIGRLLRRLYKVLLKGGRRRKNQTTFIEAEDDTRQVSNSHT